MPQRHQRRNPRPRAAEPDTTLLIQPDLGGGQRLPEAEERPRGTRPVSAFAGPLTNGSGHPGASGPFPVAPGEAEAATEDGFPGADSVRFADAIAAGAMPAEGVRGALYQGPERRKNQDDWEHWQQCDRRESPFQYAGAGLTS